MEKKDALRYRVAPLEMTPSEFRKAGYQLVERIAEFLCTLPDRPVTPNEPPAAIREALECQVQLRAAGGAEMHPYRFSAAPRSDLENRGRALRHAEVFEPKYRFNHIGRAGRPLAKSAMADRDPQRVRARLVPDCFAEAPPGVDHH